MKKKIYKRWWFWVIIAIVGIVIIGSVAGSSDDSGSTGTGSGDSEGIQSSEKTEKTYQKVDLQTMIDDLKGNALRAESKYQNAYVEITGEISNIDSDGSYISIKPSNDEWNFVSVMCYIKNDTQKNFIVEKSVGDVVTIKGKITSIGEVLGYSLNIESIS